LAQGRGVRRLVLLFCLTAVSSQAQEQENKLVDRLLRPDMTLSNPAQNKKFTGTGGTPVDKKFAARSFYTVDGRMTKSFSGVKDCSARGFETKKYTRADQVSSAKSSVGVANANAEFVTKKSSLARTAREEGKAAATRVYADSRPFLAQGTRQKILSKENKPLTIDEVRQLLNKNK
jgi:hypothetical protein